MYASVDAMLWDVQLDTNVQEGLMCQSTTAMSYLSAIVFGDLSQSIPGKGPKVYSGSTGTVDRLLEE